MRTPSLRRRTTLYGVLVVAGIMLVFDVALFLAVRADLNAALDEVLATRLDAARGFADDVPVDQLANRLTRAGIPAVVTTDDGRSFVSEPASPRLGLAPPAAPGDAPADQVTLAAELPGGQGRIEVFATTAGVDQTLRRLLLIEALLTVGGIGLAVVLLTRAADAAISPLDHVVDTAQRTAAGQTGQRLEPDQPDTELGQMAVAFDDMLDALERALQESREAEERSARFLADAAHQLRTPIAGIRASVESLLLESSPAERDRLLSNLIREASRGSRVLANLLTIARLDKGRPPARVPTDLTAICQEEVERARSLAPQLDVALDVEGELPEVPVAAHEIREALANLLDNARRHAASRVVVRVGPVDDQVTITVADDGPGIPSEARALVFERFATLDTKGGSGLGLPIARAVARSHGGDLVYRDDVEVATSDLAEAGRQRPSGRAGGGGGGGFVMTLPAGDGAGR